MKTFEIGKLFHEGNVQTSVTLMDFPYLIPDAFYETREGKKLSIPLLRSILSEYSKNYILLKKESGKEERLLERALKTLETANHYESACPNGFFGLDGLEQSLKDLDDPTKHVMISAGMSNVTFKLLRLGDCIAMLPTDSRGENHQDAIGILDDIMERTNGVMNLIHFVRQYGFSIVPNYAPDGNNGGIFDVADEIAKWRVHAPLINWVDAEVFTQSLSEDFISSSDNDDGGVVIGSYGDMDVLMRIKSAKNSKDDMAWRRGYIRSQTATRIVFESNHRYMIEVEYFLRVKNLRPCWLTAVSLKHSLDYGTEQHCMAAVARMMYAGLYSRSFEQTMSHNSHLRSFVICTVCR
ncbi:MAG: hypothetical protein PHH40_01010 [Candidatus Moranbacteria bacterium]|nr:hypothetical protein [Candidatus Moranbacteria bacterium]MDD3964894.1 hypothetical protein [Candidatus Moranbacteria bacterium]